MDQFSLPFLVNVRVFEMSASGREFQAPSAGARATTHEG
jgi:hypothetical protein